MAKNPSFSGSYRPLFARKILDRQPDFRYQDTPRLGAHSRKTPFSWNRLTPKSPFPFVKRSRSVARIRYGKGWYRPEETDVENPGTTFHLVSVALRRSEGSTDKL